MDKAVIIVAAGSGSRMGSDTPKQFMLLNNKPVLMHTINRFYEFDNAIDIVLVLPENEIETWNKLKENFSFTIPHKIAKGGTTRFQSVKNGLALINRHCIVAIHDGVRPLCTTSLINRCFTEAEKNSNAIPAIPVTDSIREIKNGNPLVIDRENLRIIQTPQCFDSKLLEKAYRNSDAENFTDDAGVFEKDGNKIYLVEGDRNNIKITVQGDLLIASAIEKEMVSTKK